MSEVPLEGVRCARCGGLNVWLVDGAVTECDDCGHRVEGWRMPVEAARPADGA
jgi:DNA-directed RNA polymerase subunit RPC12/RpoP